MTDQWDNSNSPHSGEGKSKWRKSTRHSRLQNQKKAEGTEKVDVFKTINENTKQIKGMPSDKEIENAKFFQRLREKHFGLASLNKLWREDPPKSGFPD